MEEPKDNSENSQEPPSKPPVIKRWYTDEFDAFKKFYTSMNFASDTGLASQIINEVCALPYQDPCFLTENIKRVPLKTEQNVEVPPVLEPSNTIEFAHELIKMDQTLYKGAGLFATGNFAMGDILINEKASVLQINPPCLCQEEDYKMYRCHHCAYAVHKFYTCSGCNVVVYCSLSCLRQSYRQYHKFECEAFQRHFWKMDNTDFSYMAFRMVLYGAWFGFNMNIPSSYKKWGRDGSNYPYIYRLASNFDKLPVTRVCEILEKAARTIIYLTVRTNFFKSFNAPNEDSLLVYVGGLFVRHYCQAQINAIQAKFPNFDHGYAFNVAGATGKAICPTIALINHSCSPNAVIIPRGEQFLVKALRTIRKDEEITIAYYEISNFMDLEQRQLIMTNYFYFSLVCQCAFCLHEETWMEFPYQCRNCSVGQCKKLTLNNGDLRLICNKCYFLLDVPVKEERVVDIAAKWYRATYEINPLVRILKCYTNLFPPGSWMMLDIYRVLYEKYSSWGEWPMETIRYGVFYFEVLELYICRLYPPFLEAKLKFLFKSVNNSNFLNLSVLSYDDSKFLDYFVDFCLEARKDVQFYVPKGYMEFYYLGLLKKLDKVQKRIKIESTTNDP